MIEKQLDELFPEMTLNTNSRVRIKCLVVYLRKMGYQRKEIAKIARIDEDTVTNYTKMYDESGLPGLLEENYHQPKSQLEPYTEQLKEFFKKQLPHTVNQAIEPSYRDDRQRDRYPFEAVCLPGISEKNRYEMQTLWCGSR